MRHYVLDSFALVAHLRDEPGSQRVTELLRDASRGQNELFMCLVNLGEVHYLTRACPQNGLGG